MQDPYYLLEKCLYQPKPCLIAFLNGDYNEITQSIRSKFYTDIYKIQNTTENSTYWGLTSPVYVVNATCHDDLLNEFKLQWRDLPALVGYMGEYESFGKMTKEFEPVNISKFAKKLSDSAVSNTKPLKREDIRLARKECHLITEKKNMNKLFDYGKNLDDEDDKDYDDVDVDLDDSKNKNKNTKNKNTKKNKNKNSKKKKDL